MSLHTTYDDENIFAKIINGDIPSAKVYEDTDCLAFMDAFPQSEGHTLVIHKAEKAVNFLDVGDEALTSLILTTKRIARAMKAALNPDGIRLIQYNGEAAGQSVYHLHFHLIPMWEGRPLGAHGGSQAEMAALQALADKISAKL